MRIAHVFFLALMSLCLCLPAAAQTPGGDEAAIDAVIARQASAWNAGDGVAWGADYLADADFVNILGAVFHGRSEIAERHAAIFAGPYKGSHLAIAVRSLKLLAPGIALAETNMEVTGYRGLPPGIQPTAPGVLRTHMKYVLAKQDGQWWISAAQNTAEFPVALRP